MNGSPVATWYYVAAFSHVQRSALQISLVPESKFHNAPIYVGAAVCDIPNSCTNLRNASRHRIRGAPLISPTFCYRL